MNLKYYRNAAGLTQEQLAEKIESNKSTISELENGRFRPGIDLAQDLADALGVSLFDLFFAVHKDD